MTGWLAGWMQTLSRSVMQCWVHGLMLCRIESLFLFERMIGFIGASNYDAHFQYSLIYFWRRFPIPLLDSYVNNWSFNLNCPITNCLYIFTFLPETDIQHLPPAKCFPSPYP